jgi:alpha-D-ribose 1-methylphosphonate 5-triphosphate synthase subunit PhnI
MIGEDVEISMDEIMDLLEIYMDLVEKQDVVIYHMSNVIKKQHQEIQHYKNLHDFVDFHSPLGLESDIKDADEALREYERMKETD